MVPIFQETSGNPKLLSYKAEVILPPRNELVTQGFESGVKAMSELAQQREHFKRMKFSVAYYRQDPAEFLAKNPSRFENDYFYTVPVLVVENAPKAIRKKLPTVKFQDEEYDFLANSSHQGAFVTQNERKKEAMVIPTSVLEDALLSGSLPCSKIKDGSYLPGGSASQNFIPDEDIFPLIAETFPLNPKQVEYVVALEEKEQKRISG